MVTQAQGQRRKVVEANVKVVRYPDGGSWLEQDALVTEVFDIMSDEIKRVAKSG